MKKMLGGVANQIYDRFILYYYIWKMTFTNNPNPLSVRTGFTKTQLVMISKFNDFDHPV